MYLFEGSFGDPARDLACDEALLEMCERGEADGVLRFWEPSSYYVVVGYSNRVETEVRVASCKALGIPIMRRCSGGGTVVQGPGCLNYALVLRMDSSGPLATITGTTAHIMGRHCEAIQRLTGSNIQVQGHSDLTIGAMKFSGNAQRRAIRCVLFHGVFLLDFDLPLVGELLQLPSRQPEYRQKRSHQDFITNLRISGAALRTSLSTLWHATVALPTVPHREIERLVAERYASPAWNFKL